MKRLISVLVVMTLFMSATSYGAGLLPTMTDAYGIAMPSLCEVLNRYPDDEKKESDGSTVQTWKNVKNEDFEAFSEYLSTAGAVLSNYSVTDRIFSAEIEKSGRTFTFVYDPQSLSAMVTYPAGTYDGICYEAESHYNSAKKYMKNGQFDDALEEILLVKNYKLYKDINNLLVNNDGLKSAVAARDAKYSIGNYIFFGTYPQSRSGNDKTPIEWLVLDRKGQSVLLISKYGLDCQPYDSDSKDYVPWEECSLRAWLNNSFIKTAFTENEQGKILLSKVDNRDANGKTTQDKLFLLSLTETKKYYHLENDWDGSKTLCCSPTQYAKGQGAKDASLWWLRSPDKGYTDFDRGGNYFYDVNVVHNGTLTQFGEKARENGVCVRPVLWLNIE